MIDRERIGERVSRRLVLVVLGGALALVAVTMAVLTLLLMGRTAESETVAGSTPSAQQLKTLVRRV